MACIALRRQLVALNRVVLSRCMYVCILSRRSSCVVLLCVRVHSWLYRSIHARQGTKCMPIKLKQSISDEEKRFYFNHSKLDVQPSYLECLLSISTLLERGSSRLC